MHAENYITLVSDVFLEQTKFHELMSDLPEPFTLSQYSKHPSLGKIKLRMPKAAVPTGVAPPAVPVKATPAPTPMPARQVAPPRAIAPPPLKASTPAPTPVAETPPPQSAGGINLSGVLMLGPSVPGSAAPAQQQQGQGLPKMTNTTAPPRRIQAPATRHSTRAAAATPTPQQSHPAHQNSFYQQVLPPASAISPPIPTNATITKLTASKAGLALPKPKQPLKRAMLRAEPSGRLIQLRRDEGVQTWMMRLGHQDRAVSLTELVFVSEEEEEEEDDEDAMDVDGDQPLRRPRGRPPKSPAARAAAFAKANAKPVKGGSKEKEMVEVQVKLNSLIMPERDEESGAWYLDLAVGQNLVEMGSRDGTNWNVHINRSDLL